MRTVFKIFLSPVVPSMLMSSWLNSLPTNSIRELSIVSRDVRTNIHAENENNYFLKSVNKFMSRQVLGWFHTVIDTFVMYNSSKPEKTTF